MLIGIKDTLNPNKGEGAMETFIFILLMIIVVGVMILSAIHSEIPPLIQTIATGLMGYVGYMVGKNSKEEWSDDERREGEELDE